MYIGETETIWNKTRGAKKEVDNVTTSWFIHEEKGAKVIDRESNRNLRWIKKVIWIRKTTPIMNPDEG